MCPYLSEVNNAYSAPHYPLDMRGHILCKSDIRKTPTFDLYLWLVCWAEVLALPERFKAARARLYQQKSKKPFWQQWRGGGRVHWSDTGDIANLSFWKQQKESKTLALLFCLRSTYKISDPRMFIVHIMYICAEYFDIRKRYIILREKKI